MSGCNSCALLVYSLECSEFKVVARHFGYKSESLSMHTALFDMLHTVNNEHQSILSNNNMHIINVVQTVLDFLMY